MLCFAHESTTAPVVSARTSMPIPAALHFPAPPWLPIPSQHAPHVVNHNLPSARERLQPEPFLPPLPLLPSPHAAPRLPETLRLFLLDFF
ncbi:hypothetical protein BS50DRAFT_568330 [Corynespora cassiicola Philippines]|uniref:Uncharacterized protein n=1 Tax=Corynespora cassiicola Philippines TaxID=1448308 RepID=A0A2T2P4V2_CORCC|nr:hypothetical protein BS50DRAFT_568330 [Corynespora cassiicola Philippines]